MVSDIPVGDGKIVNLFYSALTALSPMALLRQNGEHYFICNFVKPSYCVNVEAHTQSRVLFVSSHLSKVG